MTNPTMTDLPETVVLKPSQLKLIGLAVMGAALTVAGAAMVRFGSGLESFAGWAALILFGAVMIIAVIQLIDTGSQLVLDGEGFRYSMFGRRKAFRWDEVSEFALFTQRQRGMVVNRSVVFTPHAKAGKGKLFGVIPKWTGGSDALPDSFGMKAKALVELMNAFRARALGEPPATASPA